MDGFARLLCNVLMRVLGGIRLLRLTHQPVNLTRPSRNNCSPKQIEARPKCGVLQRASLAAKEKCSAQELHAQATTSRHLPDARRRKDTHMSHGRCGSSYSSFAWSGQGFRQYRKPSDQRSSWTDPPRQLFARQPPVRTNARECVRARRRRIPLAVRRADPPSSLRKSRRSQP